MQIMDREWYFRSTQTLNLNMYEQNNQVREELQKKHTIMYNLLQEKHADILNSLGRVEDAIQDNQRDILKGTETIKAAIVKSCKKKYKRNRGRLLETSKAFNDAVIEDGPTYSENEEVGEDIVGLIEKNLKLEQLQKDMDNRFVRLEDKIVDLQKDMDDKFIDLQKDMDDKFGRLEDRLETILGKLVEQQMVA